MTEFLINRVQMTDRTATATVNGKEMPATVKVLEVELVHEGYEQGSILKTFWTPEDKEAAKAKYVQGATIDLDI